MKIQAHNFTVLLLVLSVTIGLSTCVSTRSSSPSTPITLQLSWTHSAQFAGFYAADQNGDYAAEGLAVTFVEGGPDVDRQTPVLNGTAHFGLGGGVELITARADGKPVRVVATILRRDPFAFFTLAGSGITRPEDFVGKTLLVRPRALPILGAMMANVGISPDQYTVNSRADFTALYSGEVDVATGFVKLPPPRPNNAPRRLAPLLTVTMSRTPSPLKRPVTTAEVASRVKSSTPAPSIRTP